jgi:hypothetical protein
MYTSLRYLYDIFKVFHIGLLRLKDLVNNSRAYNFFGEQTFVSEFSCSNWWSKVVLYLIELLRYTYLEKNEEAVKRNVMDVKSKRSYKHNVTL